MASDNLVFWAACRVLVLLRGLGMLPMYLKTRRRQWARLPFRERWLQYVSLFRGSYVWIWGGAITTLVHLEEGPDSGDAKK